MEVILTHDQADFDAVASLLAGHLVKEVAIPVLPARLNRNVRNFLNLYRDDLPFVEAQDLPAQKIDRVILVDTQSLVSLKGINAGTDVQVVDHHSIRTDLPEGWELKWEKVGATTTIFVSQMDEETPQLSPLEATLLLLGIYEDTGSLTYASTDFRDASAAAFLLQRGADLKIVGKFLNPPLSEGQRKLADQLLENIQSHQINGKSIVISHAEAIDLNEEVSSIAHKLRDLLDPDGLFLFVNSSEGIRLVARSTSDQVNVASIARHFGGGGHDRAAAALIHPREEGKSPATLTGLCEEVVAILSQSIMPPLTVGKIMSKRPHLVGVSTSLEEAEKLMQRYGYEGFPVEENGRVVGLLTRRAVDRALNHKLNLNAGSLMEAGEYSLKSNDTIERLQSLMSETGWGQIPVVDPVSGAVIGIVTRTDLLKTLPGKERAQSREENLAVLLKNSLPPIRLALLELIAGFADKEHVGLYIVGGFVRDLLLHQPSLDFDIVVEGDAVKFARSISLQLGGRVVHHHRFGTAKWQIGSIKEDLLHTLDLMGQTVTDLPDFLDFISARTEFYDHPTALPTVERSSIKLDLHRRDFTINTLALRLDGKHYGELYDYWGGLVDLEKKQVRVLHSLSFVDDPTRLLRAVRFEQRFGFQIEKHTLQLVREARELLRQLGGERIQHEFNLIFNEKNPTAILTRLETLGFLDQIHPNLKWDQSLDCVLIDVLNRDKALGWNLPNNVGNTPIQIVLAYLVWLTGFGEETAGQIGERLRLPIEILETLTIIAGQFQDMGRYKCLSPSQFTFALEKTPLYGLYVLYNLVEDKKLKSMLQSLGTTWYSLQPGINGSSLKRRGIPPGPLYSQVLTKLRAAWLDGLISDKVEEKELFEKLLREGYE